MKYLLLFFLSINVAHADWYINVDWEIPECNYDKNTTIDNVVINFLNDDPEADCRSKKQFKGDVVRCTGETSGTIIAIYKNIYKCRSGRRMLLKHFKKYGGKKPESN